MSVKSADQDLFAIWLSIMGVPVVEIFKESSQGRCDDISMKNLIGVTTHTLILVMSYHLQKVLLRRAKRTVGKR